MVQISNFGLAVSSGIENKDSVELTGALDYVAPEYTLEGLLAFKVIQSFAI